MDAIEKSAAVVEPSREPSGEFVCANCGHTQHYWRQQRCEYHATTGDGAVTAQRCVLDARHDGEHVYVRVEPPRETRILSADIRYCLGFLFSPDESGVVLLRKTHPDWQAGKVNGLGGHVEAGESPLDAMDRESGEELGASFLGLGWSLYDVMRGEKADGRTWSCHCYRAFDARWDKTPLQNDVGEAVKLVSVAKIATMPDVIPNLRWLIPKALDRHEEYDDCERAIYEREITALRSALSAAQRPQ